MLQLHPEILRRNGIEQFAVLPYDEFLAVQELLEDLEDLRLIEEAKKQDSGEPSVTLDQMKREMGLS